MIKIKCENNTTRLYVNGIEIRNLTGIKFSHQVHEVPELTLDFVIFPQDQTEREILTLGEELDGIRLEIQ